MSKKILLNADGKVLTINDKVLKAPEGYVKPSGTKEITDTNLTDVTSYANAQVVDSNLIADNIKKDIAILGITGTYEGEGGSSSWSQEAERQIKTKINNEKSKLTPTYNKTYDTTENITIYTPNEQCRYYYIAYKSSSGFRIIWVTENIVHARAGDAGIYSLDRIEVSSGGCSLKTETNNFLNEEPKFSLYEASVYFDITNKGFTLPAYRSNYYSTIEECIEALKSNTTIYEKAKENGFFGGNEYANGTPVIITNGIEVNGGSGYSLKINQCGRQLSTNETIMVIE